MQPCSFEKSKKMWAEALTLIGGGSQGTRAPEFPEYPIYFDRAKGCRMWDVDGNEIIDLLCSIGPIILGYAYDRVDDAAKEIMKTSFQSSMNHPIQLDLAKLLIEYIPSAERVRYFKTGTEATTAAVRLARFLTNRTYVAAHGYHGWTDMWRPGMTGHGVNTAAWEVVPTFDGTAEGLEKMIKESGKEFAAVIICPVDARPFTKENFQGMIDVAHRHGAIAIFDEIKSGFRTALGGAQELLGVMPDITTVSKGMANGYPLSAVVGKAEYMDKINQTPSVGTFSVEALSLAASIATLKELKEKNVVDHLWRTGNRLIDGLNKIVADHGIEGPLAYPDPVPSIVRFTWKPDTTDFDQPEHLYFYEMCFKYGLFFSSWHVAFVNYSHTDADIDEALNICDYAMTLTKKKFYK